MDFLEFYKKCHAEYANSMHPWHLRFIEEFDNFSNKSKRRYVIIGEPGVAKTTLGATLAIWMAIEYPYSQINIIAGTQQQIEQNMFAFIQNIIDTFENKDKYKVTTRSVSLPNNSIISLRAYDRKNEASLRGIHPKKEGAIVAFFVDEAIAFSQQAFVNINNIHAVGLSFEMLLSNGWQPDTKSFLPVIWHNQSDTYRKIYIAHKAENVRPSRKTEDFIRESEKLFGSAFEMTMRGGGMSLSSGWLTYEDIQKINNRFLTTEYYYQYPIMGIDCAAGITNGWHAIAIRDGNRILYCKSFSETIEELKAKVQYLVKEYNVKCINVDACGVGRVIADILAGSNKVFSNSKHKFFSSVRTMLVKRFIDWARDPRASGLFNTAMSYLMTNITLRMEDGKMYCTEKKDLKKIVGNGGIVDEFDAILYTFYKGRDIEKIEHLTLKREVTNLMSRSTSR